MKHTERAKRNRAAGFFLAVFLWGWCAHGQTSDLPAGELQGHVLEDAAGIPNVHIINLSSEQATITNEEGYFRLEAREGDTLLISAIRFQRKTLTVSRAMLEAAMLEIAMEPFVNQLDEVVLWPYNLSGDLDQDLSNLPVEEPVTATSLGLPNARAKVKTQTERKLYEATSGAGLIPLNPVLNAITGRTRMLKKRLSRDRAYQQTLQVRSLYPDSLFTGELHIPEVRIPDFMYFCEVDPAFGNLASVGDKLRMWEFLKGKSEQYRRNNGIE